MSAKDAIEFFLVGGKRCFLSGQATFVNPRLAMESEGRD